MVGNPHGGSLFWRSPLAGISPLTDRSYADLSIRLAHKSMVGTSPTEGRVLGAADHRKSSFAFWRCLHRACGRGSRRAAWPHFEYCTAYATGACELQRRQPTRPLPHSRIRGMFGLPLPSPDNGEAREAHAAARRRRRTHSHRDHGGRNQRRDAHPHSHNDGHQNATRTATATATDERRRRVYGLRYCTAYGTGAGRNLQRLHSHGRGHHREQTDCRPGLPPTTNWWSTGGTCGGATATATATTAARPRRRPTLPSGGGGVGSVGTLQFDQMLPVPRNKLHHTRFVKRRQTHSPLLHLGRQPRCKRPRMCQHSSPMRAREGQGSTSRRSTIRPAGNSCTARRRGLWSRL